ncbi:MAG: tRNA uridine-5-carboxymethylaminomethyl(34) synthesis GTPase MnmE [Synergistaceae bacterium]|jgi:tRNA modification GTPase|nr:tRNA uridine-5-carboxymethylaminomethyl(34) synthesis GTPase MnmE [Synergistaceae bacterium]
MPNSDDVIAAVATAWGESAIAIVRMSGWGSVSVAEKIFRGARPLSLERPRRMALGVIAQDGDVVDQVLAVRFERGASYTGEESVELHCHGGVCAARRCIGMLVNAGARVALPGEFTKRAFLSGRIDLAQAEAVSGVIRARSDAELVASSRSLQGELSSRLSELSSALTALRAEIEARIDFPEDVSGDEYAGYSRAIAELASRTSSLLERCRVGLVLRNGVRVAIVGRPNVGKSSLMNALLERDRAIVTDIPGTTRDTLDAEFVHGGIAITLVDTAGMRDPGGGSGADIIETMGVERSREAIKGADFCVLVIDASRPVSDEDIAAARAALERPAILALNKSDLPEYSGDGEPEPAGNFVRRVKISALTGDGVGDLKDVIAEASLGSASPSDGMMATERMVWSIECALKCMEDAREAIGMSRGADVAGSLLGEAAEHIAFPLGADASEKLLDAIFSTFCVGK